MKFNKNYSSIFIHVLSKLLKPTSLHYLYPIYLHHHSIHLITFTTTTTTTIAITSTTTSSSSS